MRASGAGETTYHGGRSWVTLLERCRGLRMTATDAEALLWRLLRAHQVGGAKFRRQHQYGPYILDFYCHERGLCVEIDGGQHATPDGVAKDAERTRYLEESGLRVLRFSNREVLGETESVLGRVWEAVETPSP